MSEPLQESVLEVSETGNENENWYTPSMNQQNKLDNDDEGNWIFYWIFFLLLFNIC